MKPPESNRWTGKPRRRTSRKEEMRPRAATEPTVRAPASARKQAATKMVGPARTPSGWATEDWRLPARVRAQAPEQARPERRRKGPAWAEAAQALTVQEPPRALERRKSREQEFGAGDRRAPRPLPPARRRAKFASSARYVKSSVCRRPSDASGPAWRSGSGSVPGPGWEERPKAPPSQAQPPRHRRARPARSAPETVPSEARKTAMAAGAQERYQANRFPPTRSAIPGAEAAASRRGTAKYSAQQHPRPGFLVSAQRRSTRRLRLCAKRRPELLPLVRRRANLHFSEVPEA